MSIKQELTAAIAKNVYTENGEPPTVDFDGGGYAKYWSNCGGKGFTFRDLNELLSEIGGRLTSVQIQGAIGGQEYNLILQTPRRQSV